jgi:hypothetical protein
MNSKEAILDEFRLFCGDTGGIDSWLTASTDQEVFDRLARIEREPLPKVQLNQLLLLSHQAGVSDGFYQYYWLSTPLHPYEVERIPDFHPSYAEQRTISSVQQLRWGMYRIYVDSLLYFGSIRNGYRFLRNMSFSDLQSFFTSRRYDTDAISKRGPALPMKQIARDDRYLISEMACKTYDALPDSKSDLKQALLGAWHEHVTGRGGSIRIRELLDGSFVRKNFSDTQQQLVFSADDILDAVIASEQDIEKRYAAVANAFSRAREAALQNTRLYLSMVNDLDVYVATSMRTREDFRTMAATCERIFKSDRLRGLHLRYFDPTMSAAAGHEDKGLIECLMVKSAKALVYYAGEKESYGKDAEAAMALSLGKPVVFLCDQRQRSNFYRDVHPLSRLINFETGVAGGALVTDSTPDVAELLGRIFENGMEYELEHPKKGYFRLKEKLTQSVVRLQTNDQLLRETFWNYYHTQSNSPAIEPADVEQ